MFRSEKNPRISNLEKKQQYLVCVDNDLALLLVAAGDDEHVVEAGGVVDQALVLVGGQHVAGSRLQEVNTALVNSQPEILGPVGGEGLLKIGSAYRGNISINSKTHIYVEQSCLVQGPALDQVKERLFRLLHIHACNKIEKRYKIEHVSLHRYLVSDW